MMPDTLRSLICILFILLYYQIPSTQSSKIDECNLKTDYILKDLTSGEFLGCSHVRACGVGHEPIIPRGQVIGRHDIIGRCRPCDNGTYSPTNGPEPCQICRGANCSEHQVGEGTCTDKRDDSDCKCKDGYVQNKKGTACEIYKPQQLSATGKPTKNQLTTKKPTTGMPTTREPTAEKPATNTPTTKKPATPNLTTSNPTTNSTKTKNDLVPINERKDNQSELPLGWKVAIALIVVIVIVGLVIVIRYWYFKRLQKIDRRGKDEKNLPSSEQLLDKTEAGKEEEILKFGKEEQSKEDGLPRAINGLHCKESPDGYVTSKLAASDNAYPDTLPQKIEYNQLLIGIPNNSCVKLKVGKANEW